MTQRSPEEVNAFLESNHISPDAVAKCLKKGEDIAQVVSDLLDEHGTRGTISIIRMALQIQEVRAIL